MICNFTDEQLRFILKKSNSKYLSRIKKRKTLIIKVTQYFAVVKIQRWFRKINACNLICPISFEIVRYPCWMSKNKIYYNIPTVTDYFAFSKDFRDPCSRKPLTRKDIIQLESMHDKMYNLITLFDISIIDREIDEQISIFEDNYRVVIYELIDDLYTSQQHNNLNEIIGSKIYELKICLGVLSNICNVTYINMVEWSLEQLNNVEVQGTIDDVRQLLIQIIYEDTLEI